MGYYILLLKRLNAVLIDNLIYTVLFFIVRITEKELIMENTIINTLSAIVSLITAFYYFKGKADLTAPIKAIISKAEKDLASAEKAMDAAEKKNDLKAYKAAINAKNAAEKEKADAEKRLEDAKNKSFKDADFIHAAILYCLANGITYTQDELNKLVFDICKLHSAGQFSSYTIRQFNVVKACGLTVTVK